jgi:hypothetical protein
VLWEAGFQCVSWTTEDIRGQTRQGELRKDVLPMHLSNLISQLLITDYSTLG